VGIFNGVADAANTANADFDNDKDVDARVFAQPFRNDAESFLQGLGFGIAASAGREKGAAGVTAGYKTDGQQTFFKYRSSVVADGGVWRVSPQACYYHGPFGALGEYVVSTVNARPAAAAPKSPLQNRAWQLAAGYVLTGEDASYTGVTPREPFNWKNGAWGAWQIAVRYAELKIDPRAFPLFADPAANANAASALGFGVNWYLSRTVRASLDYFRTHFTLNVPAPSVPLLRQDENALLTRLQVSF
jgi:phosphate-selective porin OprO/OprP